MSERRQKEGREGGVVVWSMPLSLFLGGMVHFYCLPICCCYPVGYFPYWFEGRFAGYFPTISETGTDYPNTQVIRFTLGFVAMITFYSLLLSFYYIEYWHAFSKRMRAIRWALLIVATIGTMGIGCFSLATDHDRHFTSASTSFAAVCFVELIDLIAMFGQSSRLLNANRIVSLVIQVVALTVIARARTFIHPRLHDTIDGLSEFATLGSMGWFYSTFYDGFRKMELSLFMVV
jgi:hypothetical protein